MLLFESFSVKNDDGKDKNDCCVGERMTRIEDKIPMIDSLSGSHNIFWKSKSFKIWKKKIEKLGYPGEDEILSSQSCVENRRDRVTNNVGGNGQQDRKERRNKCRKEEDDSKKCDEFEVDEANSDRKEIGPWSSRICYHNPKKQGLEYDDTEEYKSKTKKFSQDKLSSGNRF